MKAIVLFSGGIDSTVALAIALNNNRECLALSFDYGQRHRIELESAKKIAAHYGVQHRIIKIDPATFGQSSLVDHSAVPKNRNETERSSTKTPPTYVPGRNTLFLAYAIGQAEMFGAGEIYIGPNAHDQNPYPDCRPQFIEAFQQVCQWATKQAKEGTPPTIIAPLIDMTKKEIVKKGIELDAPLLMTHSCYDPTEKGSACNACDACILRNAALYRT